MTNRNSLLRRICRFSLSTFLISLAFAAKGQVVHDAGAKAVRIASKDNRIALRIDYSSGCRVAELSVNGKNTLSTAGSYTAVRTADAHWTSANAQPDAVRVSAQADQVTLAGIALGDITETWRFSVQEDNVRWTIQRTYPEGLQLEEMGMPTWQFADLQTWKGGILDNGGMVWCKYLASPDDTYGVHTGGVTFWNEDQADALRIAVRDADGKAIATKFSHGEAGAFACTHLVSDDELGQRHNLSRFVHKKADVFAPFAVGRETVQVTYELSYVDYLKAYDRGHLPGIDVSSVRELLNTTGRYGVVDNRIVGANGWITNWKCLHEPFFAQIGLALNDDNYTANLSATLDQERDLAMLPDGRVLSRWHDVPGDEIPGTYNRETGYYEAMWGYTVDSQTGYVINAAEQFQQTGDIAWLRAHKESCERALDWLIRRDTNGNGIFEMVNNNVAEEKASDWIDIVWAGFENAFVNAQQYEALKLWAECERIMGDTAKSAHYLAIAAKLKAAFNKTVDEGGFWSPEKKQYVYWRDADGTVRGDNLVTPVNFAAIAYGICDDERRIATILEHIEQRTAAEGLFHWPLCFDSFKREEVHDNNWPFPRYENGDIFPTWGYLGIRSYVKFDKKLALKYIHNILAQYRKDGLSSQRYSRTTQQGLGTDILAGISTTVTALYSDIYGIRPQWNRLGVVPNMVPALNGTQFSYMLRDTVYDVSLSVNDYLVSTEGLSVRSNQAFGVGRLGHDVVYYPNNEDSEKLVVHTTKNAVTDLQVTRWEDNDLQWTLRGNGRKRITIQGLMPSATYELSLNGKIRQLNAKADGSLVAKVGAGVVTVNLRLH